VRLDVAANDRRALAVCAAFALPLLLVGGLLTVTPVVGAWALALSAALAVAGLLAALLAGERIALAAAGAAPASEDAFPRYHNLVEGLCSDLGMPKPALYVLDEVALNALAVGLRPRHASVAVTRGLLTKLNRIELEGVLAHELVLIRSHATRPRTIAVVLGGLSALCWYRRGPGPRALWTVPAVLAAPLTPLLRLAGCGRAGIDADQNGAYLTRYPPGLASALTKLATDPERLAPHSLGIGHLWLVPPTAVTPPGWLQPERQPTVTERVELLKEL
jgi:heat shock protein HtpX